MYKFLSLFLFLSICSANATTIDKMFSTSTNGFSLKTNTYYFHNNNDIKLSNFIDENGKPSLNINLQKVQTSFIDKNIANISRFKGTIESDKNSTVYLTAIDNIINCKVIKSNGIEYSIIKNDDTYNIYNKYSLLNNVPTLCSTVETDNILPFVEKNKFAKPLSNKLLQVNLAIDVCKEWYLWKFKNDTVKIKNYILSVYSMVSFIYEKEMNVTLHISWLKIRTTTDPYNSGGDANSWGGTPYIVLAAMPSYWKTNNLDVKTHLVHAVSVGGKGGVANYDAFSKDIHSGDKYGPFAALSINGDNKFNGDPTSYFDFDVHTIAHEMGHNFNCPHTHSCSWNPPIDTCVVYDGGNDGCPTSGSKRICTQYTETSIMSYCREINNWVSKMTFLSKPADLIRTYAEKYLKEYDNNTVILPPILVYPLSDEELNTVNVGFKWRKNDVTLKYKFELSNNDNFDTLIVDTIISKDTLTLFNLKGITNYYWRVIAINSIGQATSNISSFKTGYSIPEIPTLHLPINNTIIYSDSVILTWTTSDKTITKYIIQIADNDNYDNALIDSTIDTFYVFKPLHDADYFWRVKSLNQQNESEYSNDYSFTIIKILPSKVINLVSPKNNHSTNNNIIKFTWNKDTTSYLGYKLIISKDSNFSSKYFEKIIEDDTSFIWNALNGTYYWRIQSSNNVFWDKFSEYRKFTTGFTSINEDTSNFIEVYCTPNILKEYGYIHFSLINKSHVTISIFNSNGQSIETLVNGEDLISNQYVIPFEVGTKTNGKYFIEFKSESYNKCIPIIILN